MRIHLVFVLCLLGLTTQPVHSADKIPHPIAAHLSDKDTKIIETWLRALKSKQIQIATEAAEHLGRFPYFDVYDALSDRLITEMGLTGEATPNADLLRTILKSIATIGTMAELDDFTDGITSLWNEAKLDLKKKEVWAHNIELIDAEFTKTTKSLRARPGVLSALPATSKNLIVSDQSFEIYLKGHGTTQVGAKVESTHEGILSNMIERYITDEIKKSRDARDYIPVYGSEKEANAVLDTFERIQARIPLLVGPPSSGETTIFEKIGEMILDGKAPARFARAEVISLTAESIFRLGNYNPDLSSPTAMTAQLINALVQVQNRTGKPIIAHIKDIQNLETEGLLTIQHSLDKPLMKNLLIAGSITSSDYQQSLGKSPELQKMFNKITVAELNMAETITILSGRWKNKIEKRYGVAFDADAIETIVKQSTSLDAQVGRLEASINLLQDVAIQAQRRNIKQITGSFCSQIVIERQGFGVDTRNGAAFAGYLKDLKDGIAEDIIGQTRMISDTVDEFGSILQDSERGIRVLLNLGPNGVGKSELGRSLAKRALKNENSVFLLDGAAYQDEYSVYTLFGAKNGVLSSDTTQGVLTEFLKDPARGGRVGIIVIDEAERMSPKVWDYFTELFDTGKATAGNGSLIKPGKLLIYITSNRADSHVYPGTIDKWSDKEIIERTNLLSSDDLKKIFQRTLSGKDGFKLPQQIMNRIDRFTLAKPILKSEARAIAQKIAQKFSAKTKQDYKIDLVIEDALLDYLIEVNFSILTGARPLVRKIEDILMKARLEALAQISPQAGETLTLSLQDTNLTVASAGKKTSIPLPVIKPRYKLNDSEFVQKMSGLEENLKKRIFGQDEMLKRISQAILAHHANPVGNERPLALALIGLTATGKTESGKAVAEALYGDTKRCVTIPLGKISEEGDMNNVFGSAAGYVGSTDERVFERALRENPNGGVIIFDEFSNMGGNDRGKKDALIKKFYDLLEDGIWTSAATGEKYDLNKFIFIFTGNDGERIFKGISADDLRLEAWNDNKEKEKIHHLLTEAGVPEAFLGRLSDVILMKPLLREEVKRLGEKFIKPLVTSFAEQHVTISYGADFLRQFVESFFDPNTNARSLRSVVETRISAVITKMMLDLISSGKIKAGDPVTLELLLQDNLDGLPYRTEKSLERKVEFSVVAKQGEKVLHKLDEDFVDYAAKVIKLPYEEALATAYHEAGHAIANKPYITGQSLAFLTIIGGGTGNLNYLGYARYEDDKKALGRNPNREWIIARMASLFAGRIGQELAGFGNDAGWRQDLKMMREYGTKFLIDWGMEDKLLGVALDKNGEAVLTESQKDKLALEITKLMNAAIEKGRETLISRWSAIQKTVAHLMRTGSISGKEFDAIMADDTAVETYQKLTRAERIAHCEANMAPATGGK